MQLTKLEIKRRSLDTENLQVGVPVFLLCLPTFHFKPFFLSSKYYILSFLHDNTVITFTLLHASSYHGRVDSTQ